MMEKIRQEMQPPEKIMIGARINNLVMRALSPHTRLTTIYCRETQGIKFWISQFQENSYDYGYWCYATWHTLVRGKSEQQEAIMVASEQRLQS